MPFHKIDAIKYYYSDLLDDPNVVHAIFTRQGGVSRAPVDSLNVGGTVGDQPQFVRENTQRVFRAIGRDPGSLFDVWQVHSDKVVRVEGPRGDVPITQADVMITRSSQATLMMRFADCVPILGFDPSRRAIGLAHAGWKGTLAKAGPAMINAMVAEFACKAENIRVVLGPSIGPDHYEVGQEVVSGVEQVFGHHAGSVLKHLNNRTALDLWTANQLLLQQVGVQQVEVAGICTACHPEDWFSHRAEKGLTGRFGALIGLNGDK
jgi:YfiH family protein